jgi:hypothetical protein
LYHQRNLSLFVSKKLFEPFPVVGWLPACPHGDCAVLTSAAAQAEFSTFCGHDENFISAQDK